MLVSLQPRCGVFKLNMGQLLEMSMFISACSIDTPESLVFAKISSLGRWDVGNVS